jgi:outer membrane protein assembly factor BamE (lipoprotein component of BamABCDE complex)
MPRAGLVAVCALLLAAALAGCTTTQETAARKQAESKRILEKRELGRKHRQADRKRSERQ